VFFSEHSVDLSVFDEFHDRECQYSIVEKTTLDYIKLEQWYWYCDDWRAAGHIACWARLCRCCIKFRL